MRKDFKNTVTDLAARDDKVIVILGDISHYLFNDFQQKYPDRFYNMGICENTLISVGAGLSAQGFYPFLHTITPFITERSLEQIKPSRPGMQADGQRSNGLNDLMQRGYFILEQAARELERKV